MTNNGAASIYRQFSARGASPVGLVVSLYDTILRDFRRALAAQDSGNVESRIFELNHALTVIAHLESVLNHERGGETAKRLKSFYAVTRGMIMEINVKPTREKLQKVIDLYSGVRQAWHQADQQTGGAQSQEEVKANQKNSAALPKTSKSQTMDGSEASNGKWSA